MMTKPYFGKRLFLVSEYGCLNRRIVEQANSGDTAAAAEIRVREELLRLASRWHETLFPAITLTIVEEFDGRRTQ